MLVPLTILFGVLVIFLVPTPSLNQKKPEGVKQEAWKRVDFLGAFTLIATLIFLLIGLNTGGNILPWTTRLFWRHSQYQPSSFASSSTLKSPTPKNPSSPYTSCSTA